jgi:hypothetical protein
MLEEQLHCLKKNLQRILNFAKMSLIFQHFSSKIWCVLELFQIDDMFKNFVKNLLKKIQPKKLLKK